MKYIKIFFFYFFLISCSSRISNKSCNNIYPPYKLIIDYSKKIRKDTNLILRSYGINCHLPKDYQYINGIGNFIGSYSLSKKKNDSVSLEEARNLIVYVIENLLKDINSDPDVTPDLDVYPFVSDLLSFAIYIEDENRIHLGQGMAIVGLRNGKIKYEGYNIEIYTGKYPAIGKHYTICEESYAEALEKVSQSKSL